MCSLRSVGEALKTMRNRIRTQKFLFYVCVVFFVVCSIARGASLEELILFSDVSP